jgi:hypothetical protein
MSFVTQLPTTNNWPHPHTRHSFIAYLRETRNDEHPITLSEMARRVGVAPEFLAGAVWGATELSNSDVAHLVRAHAREVDAPVSSSRHDHDQSPQTGWPSVVAKEGSD